MTKHDLRKDLVAKRISIAEIVRQSGVSRHSVKQFRDTGKINPATLATILVNYQPPEKVKGKGEE